LLAALVGAAAPAFAAGDDAGSAPPPAWLRFVDNEFYKISVNIRGRFEYANREDLDASQAWTVRTRAGIETKPFHGFTGLAELENSFTFDKSTYWDTVTPSNGKTSIADPPNTELNRGWLRYQNADWWDLDVKGGRQWINLDDQRWIGTVGWRQNDQTYDAARIGSSFGVEQLEATYAYVWEVNRIFGDQGPPDKRDFNSQTNLLHGTEGFPAAPPWSASSTSWISTTRPRTPPTATACG
jgi:hypothetical protein